MRLLFIYLSIYLFITLFKVDLHRPALTLTKTKNNNENDNEN